MKIHHIPNAERELRFKYAEEWLDHAVSGLREYFARFGHVVPPVLVNCGYGPFGYYPKRKNNHDGLCLAKRYSKDHINEIYIAPHITEPIEVMFVLAHELIHAVDDVFSLHGATFKEIARDLGMRECGNVRYVDYVRAIQEFAKIAEPLGRYPRSGINYQNSLNLANPEYQEQRKAEKERQRQRVIKRRQMKLLNQTIGHA